MLVMIRKLFTIVTFAVISISFLSFTHIEKEVSTVKWYTWEEAVKASEKEQRKIFVDVYTDWCGWCKEMDKTTFNASNIAKYLNDENFARILIAPGYQKANEFKYVLKFAAEEHYKDKTWQDFLNKEKK